MNSIEWVSPEIPINIQIAQIRIQTVSYDSCPMQ